MKYSNEFILPHTLSDLQHQVMIGGLLGDGSLQKEGKYPRMKIDRQAIDKPYIDWQYKVFETLCLSGVREFERFDKRYNKSHKYVSFRTRAVPAFLTYYNEWYPNGIRLVPETIAFTPLILAVWFADDGCVVVKNKDCLTLKLSTESFGKAGAELLSSKLETRFGEKFPIYQKKKDKDQFFIKTSTCAANAFLKDITPHIIDIKMVRKYNIWKNHDLDYVPKKLTQIDPKLCALMLLLNDFSLQDIVNNGNIDFNHAKHYIKQYWKNGYLTRYKSNDHFNLYHYLITDLGKSFFNKQN
jgi:hypothetical protein